jgi:hypothetical protein
VYEEDDYLCSFLIESEQLMHLNALTLLKVRFLLVMRKYEDQQLCTRSGLEAESMREGGEEQRGLQYQSYCGEARYSGEVRQYVDADDLSIAGAEDLR